MILADADAVVSLTVVVQLLVIHVLPKTVIEKFAGLNTSGNLQSNVTRNLSI